MIWTAVTAVGVFIWFGLCIRLFGILRQDHPDTFRSIGSPGLLVNSTPSNNWSMLKFLFSSAPSRLGDPRVARLCRVMRVWFVLFTMWMLVPIVIIIWF